MHGRDAGYESQLFALHMLHLGWARQQVSRYVGVLSGIMHSLLIPRSMRAGTALWCLEGTPIPACTSMSCSHRRSPVTRCEPSPRKGSALYTLYTHLLLVGPRGAQQLVLILQLVADVLGALPLCQPLHTPWLSAA